jgi:hypothetical protein
MLAEASAAGSPKPAAGQTGAAIVPSHKMLSYQLLMVRRQFSAGGKKGRFGIKTRQKIPTMGGQESIC